MLNTYLTQTRNLLQNPAAPTPLYSDADLTLYINTARGQLAGEAECVLAFGTLTLSAGTRVYTYASITIPGATAAGIAGVQNVRTAWYQVASGQKWIRPRPWPWFAFYELNNPVPNSGPPGVWAQYGQGQNGSAYFSPLPDQTYTVQVDCQCYPVALVDDTTVEAIPALWTDAVPYFAAYLALLSAQTGARTAEGDKMFQRYEEFVARARRAATPSTLPTMYAQVPSPVRAVQQQASG